MGTAVGPGDGAYVAGDAVGDMVGPGDGAYVAGDAVGAELIVGS